MGYEGIVRVLGDRWLLRRYGENCGSMGCSSVERVVITCEGFGSMVKLVRAWWQLSRCGEGWPAVMRMSCKVLMRIMVVWWWVIRVFMLRRTLWSFYLKCNEVRNFNIVYMYGEYSVGRLLDVVMCSKLCLCGEGCCDLVRSWVCGKGYGNMLKIVFMWYEL